jgi:hypothetical protein
VSAIAATRIHADRMGLTSLRPAAGQQRRYLRQRPITPDDAMTPVSARGIA